MAELAWAPGDPGVVCARVERDSGGGVCQGVLGRQGEFGDVVAQMQRLKAVRQVGLAGEPLVDDFTAVVAAVWSRRLPSRGLVTGLAIGFTGVLAINLPAARDDAALTGIAMVLAATLLYGVAFNLAGPLETRNGALPVIFRALLIALVIDTPAGIMGLTESSPTASSMVAMVLLGALSTGVAFVAFATLVGRVGASRASVTVYFVPVVALTLGVTALGEPITGLATAGIALVLLGAYLTGRGTRPHEHTSNTPPHDTERRLPRENPTNLMNR